MTMESAEHVTTTLAAGTLQQYRPISDYGVIGDCRTAALVGPDGSIDWCCMPHFDSPAIFCRLLDAEKGGFFRVGPVHDAKASLTYLTNTNILETTFQNHTGRLRLLDFMPIRKRQLPTHLRDRLSALLTHTPHGLSAGLEREIGNDVAAAHRIVRMATCLEGSMDVEMVLKPTFDYARREANIEVQSSTDDVFGAIITDGDRYLVLVVRCIHTTPGKETTISAGGDDGTVRITTTLHAANGVYFALNYARTREEAAVILDDLVTHDHTVDLDETGTYWRDWAATCRYNGTYQYAVMRSALTLKLCTFEPTGAIVAAPTTSLPEDIGGVRNWDYRYTWLRDSSFTLGALGALGYTGEARDYFHFLHDLQIDSGSELSIMYSIRGESGPALDEQTLDHLAGYRGSRPVRVGNGAAMQCQLDIYGELLDAAYHYVEYEGYRSGHRHHEPDRNLRDLITVIANYVTDNWQDVDRGIWEVRGAPRPFVYSRGMCWAALDRACKLAPRHGHDDEVQRWAETRDRIHADVLEHGYSQELQSFVQSYGSDVLDAANLRLLLNNFLPWSDPRVASTVEATKQGLDGHSALIYRYRPAGGEPHEPHCGGGTTGSACKSGGVSDDGLPGKEGSFLACAFWLIDDLCYLGQYEEARERFEQLLTYASPLGLYAEEIDPETGAQLGNYPQAFTHIGLINSAVTLQRAQEGTLYRLLSDVRESKA
ncbi:MAG: glycoside hydrolase family 15 protein [Ktedonobacterales bacterium]